MDWLALLVAALDDAHGDHYECDCYDKLRRALMEGVYDFPGAPHDVPEASKYGCEDLMQYTMRTMYESISRGIYADTIRMTLLYEGLSKRITPDKKEEHAR